jgi:hypothetical protein
MFKNPPARNNDRSLRRDLFFFLLKFRGNFVSPIKEHQTLPFLLAIPVEELFTIFESVHILSSLGFLFF